MNEYVFAVQLVAAVRVRAADENVARKVVSSVLGSPGTEEVRMANENNAALGRNALVTDVDFSVGNSPTRSKADKRESKLGRRSIFTGSQPFLRSSTAVRGRNMSRNIGGSAAESSPSHSVARSVWVFT
jgi:hypothetical protein